MGRFMKISYWVEAIQLRFNINIIKADKTEVGVPGDWFVELPDGDQIIIKEADFNKEFENEKFLAPPTEAKPEIPIDYFSFNGAVPPINKDNIQRMIDREINKPKVFYESPKKIKKTVEEIITEWTAEKEEIEYKNLLLSQRIKELEEQLENL